MPSKVSKSLVHRTVRLWAKSKKVSAGEIGLRARRARSCRRGTCNPSTMTAELFAGEPSRRTTMDGRRRPLVGAETGSFGGRRNASVSIVPSTD